MLSRLFTPGGIRPIRAGMTVSRASGLAGMTWFSLGGGTEISRERYLCPALYLGGEGSGTFLTGEDARETILRPGGILFVPRETLCGVRTGEGLIYTEILLKEGTKMNPILTPGEALRLKDLINYEEESVANLDLCVNSHMKYVLMAFDAGTGLTPHRAPGDAIVFALEGEAVIGYEGEDYMLKAGECFRFEKNGLHSVTAHSRFKMALLLLLE